MKKGRFHTSLDGDRFGRWTVISFSHVLDSGHAMFNCRCDCGTGKVVRGYKLQRGESLSCGCLRNEKSSSRMTTHGLSKHRLFATWLGMNERCRNPLNAAYPSYGGRGIFVCDRWHDIANFLADMEAAWTEGSTLDRIDNNGPYSPENCRWASYSDQSLNRRNNVRFTHNGKTQTIFEWAREIGMPPKTLWARLNSGWPIGDALTIPSSKTVKRSSLVEYDGVKATIYDHARARGLNPVAIAQRIQRKGWSLEQAFNTPIRKYKTN